MKKQHLLLLILTSILISCGVFTLEKRVYRKGFYVNWNKKASSNSHKTIEQANISKNELETVTVPSNREEKHVSIQTEEGYSKVDTPVNLQQFYAQDIAPKTLNDQPVPIGVKKQPNTHFIKQAVQISKKSKSGSNHWLYGMLLVPFILYPFGVQQSIARWAQRNFRTMRAVLVFSSIFAAFLCLFLGNRLQFQYSPFVAGTSVLGLGLGILLFRNSKRGNDPIKMRKQRTLGFNLINVSAYLSLFGLGGSHVFQEANGFSKWNHFQLLANEETPTLVHSTGEIVAIIFATILLLIIISLFTAYAACILACSGFNVLAVIVAFFGLFTTVFLGALLFLLAYKKTTDENGKLAKKALWVALFTLAFSIVIGGILYLFSLS